MTLNAWAIKWGVPAAALHDLQQRFGLHGVEAVHVIPGASESAVQSRVRLEAADKGMRLFRNNVGVLSDDKGRPVRYGLANDSPGINRMIKSADLIGINPITIGPEHVGRRLGQFVSREVKAGNWRYGGTERELAQLRWAELIASLGGDAAFACGEGTL